MTRGKEDKALTLLETDEDWKRAAGENWKEARDDAITFAQEQLRRWEEES